MNEFRNEFFAALPFGGATNLKKQLRRYSLSSQGSMYVPIASARIFLAEWYFRFSKKYFRREEEINERF